MDIRGLPMYLSKLIDTNVGPIKNVRLVPSFSTEGYPKPIILVGKNGSGKSTIISNIVDALYEFLGSLYSDIRTINSSGSYNYYKRITPTEIMVGHKFMLSYLEFISTFNNSNKFYYIFKSGLITQEDIDFNNLNFEHNFNIVDERSNYKETNFDESAIKKDIGSSVICYFPPTRYEKPLWLGNSYFNIKKIEHITIRDKSSDRYDKPITIEDVNEYTLQWLLDIIVDSRCDVKVDNNQVVAENLNINNLYLLGKARENVEKILSVILGHDIYFGLNIRNLTSSRFCIIDKTTKEVIIPSLSALSSGQNALLNIFATIVRYADYNDINNSIELRDITGIIVIDEIDLHLHTELQSIALPNLIKLFPKVQFIITTHSPLFLLGMDEYIGINNYDILELPYGNKISSENFSEFHNAYQYYSNTIKFRNELSEAISKYKDKPLIITEGSTDWKHLKSALKKLCTNKHTKNEYSSLDFDFLEYEPKVDGINDSKLRLDMGDSQLIDCCKAVSLLPQNRKIIFIADADNRKTKDKMSTTDNPFKYWGNNVYSFVIPVPSHRSETPNICIEHYYKDEEIKTIKNISNIDRRLFLGNEFDSTGISIDNELLCGRKDLCGNLSIAIIDGSSGAEVIKIQDRIRNNLALPKADFANAILSGEEKFNNFDISEFKKIFDIIKAILSLPNK